MDLNHLILRKPHSKSELQKDIDDSFNGIIEIIRNQDDSLFEWQHAPDKWCTGQQLDHMIRSVVPLNQGLLLPKFVIGLVFGKMNREERSYEEVVSRYHKKLGTGYKATGRYIPKWKSTSSKKAMLSKYEKEKQTLIKRLDSWSEKNLSTYLVPHPILGKMSVREMIFFTIYHNDHHLQQLQEIQNHAKSN